MASVGKKFVDPSIWEEPWFNKLKPAQKLLYSFMWQRCDHSGVIEFVPVIWSALIGHEITEKNLDDLIQDINNSRTRLYKFEDKVWFADYIRLNQKPDRSQPLSGSQPFTKTIARLLISHSLFEFVDETDPVLFEEYLEKSNSNGTHEPSVGDRQGLSRGASKSLIRSTSDSTSGSPPLSNYDKAEELRKRYYSLMSVPTLKREPETVEINYFYSLLDDDNYSFEEVQELIDEMSSERVGKTCPTVEEFYKLLPKRNAV